MDNQLTFKLQLGNAAEVLLQDGRFDLHLMFVPRVLIVASSTLLKVRTVCLRPPRRCLQNVDDPAASEPRLLLQKFCFNLLSGKREGQKSGLASSIFVGGQTGKSVAAID